MKMKKRAASTHPVVNNSRKAQRKFKREKKKANRKEHYLKKKTVQEEPKFTPGKFVKRPAESYYNEPQSKKKKQKNISSVQELFNKEREKEVEEANKLKSEMDEQRKKLFLKANEEEDKIIKKLEKQLGLNKAKNKNNYFADDGLDYLLEVCDRTTTEQIVAAEKHLADVENESDFEDDLAVVAGKEISNKIKDKSKTKDKSKKQEASSDNENLLRDEDSDGPELRSNEEESAENNTEEDEFSEDDENNDDGDAFSGGTESDTDSGSDERPVIKPSKPNKQESKQLPKKENDIKSEKKVNKKEKIISEEDVTKVFSDDEVSHLSSDDLEAFSGEENDQDESEKANKEKLDIWEDIYGRKRDKEGNVIKEEKGTYIPPHLRNKDATSDKQLEQLKRQIKSVLNKLTGTNLHWACSSIESLYNSHSRHSVSETLCNLWLAATVTNVACSCRLVAEHAALTAVLHANVASEIGAYFMQVLAEKFDKLMQTPQPMEDKTLDNVVNCLAHLYSFKIYHASLLYDVLTRLTEELTEKNIDCVLVALRAVGGVLRKEEPLALKDFIHDTQGKIAKLNENASTGSRVKFLLEVLLAVKNNNLTKIPNYDPSYVEQLKKSMKGVVRKGNYVTPLNIRLEDLLKADERGKWWIVGSAWEGNRPLPEVTKNKSLLNADQKLLELARKQRMNTDVRRSIFCVIMSAEDYMDAFEKLQHLGLKGQQEREIVHVLLACCLQEKTYNPYYAVLGQKLCDVDRKYQLSIQFSIWDKIKELETLSKQSLANLAQFLTHLIMEKGLALSVLKVIQFSDLNKSSVKFMRQILLAIIMNEDLQASLEAFHRISKSPKLHMFRESLKLFIQHFLIKNAGKKNCILSEDEMATLKERAIEVDKILTMFDSKMKF